LSTDRSAITARFRWQRRDDRTSTLVPGSGPWRRLGVASAHRW